MMKRTIKPAAGGSRITIGAATSAARVMERNSASGRFVIVEPKRAGRPSSSARKSKAITGSRRNSKKR